MSRKNVCIEYDLYDLARNYAGRTAAKHKSYGREYLAKEEHIVTGKLGEMAYCIMNGLPLSMLNFDIDNGIDPGWDLVWNGIKIDVKTRKTPLNRMKFNPNYAHCDMFAIMSYNPGTKEFSHLLNIETGMALRNARYDKGDFYLDLVSDMDALKHCGHLADVRLIQGQ